MKRRRSRSWVTFLSSRAAGKCLICDGMFTSKSRRARDDSLRDNSEDFWVLWVVHVYHSSKRGGVPSVQPAVSPSRYRRSIGVLTAPFAQF